MCFDKCLKVQSGWMDCLQAKYEGISGACLFIVFMHCVALKGWLLHSYSNLIKSLN